MIFDCTTCDGDCKGSVKWECIVLHFYVWWSPKDKNFCEGCKMWGIFLSGNPSKCTRHAEPCSKNTRFDELWEESKKK